MRATDGGRKGRGRGRWERLCRPSRRSLGAYVLRLAHGARLLRTTMAPLATVARQVGYSPSSPSAAYTP
jgi:hypothetical protein